VEKEETTANHAQTTKSVLAAIVDASGRYGKK
jgi:hypothetical protein